MIVEDTADYIKLVGMVKGVEDLQVQPSKLILWTRLRGRGILMICVFHVSHSSRTSHCLI
jgi:hypothetical protein